MKAYQFIRFALDRQIAFITFIRPPGNVLNMDMMEEIVDALLRLQGRSDVNALVFRAEGKAFSYGVAVEDHLGDKNEPMIHLFHKMFHILSSLSFPTVAVVEGMALGGGCELATFCDFVIATEQAKFGQPEIHLGLFPPVSIVVFPWLLPLNRAMELMLTGDVIDARKAYEWGMIHRLAAADEVEAALEELLAKLRSKSTVALRLTKKAVREAMAISFAAAIGKVEQIYLRELIVSEDAQEGLASFVEKRKPVWRNR